MDKDKYAHLSNEDLLAELGKHKPSKVFSSFGIGLLFGVAVFSTVKNGFGLLTFLPLIYLPVAAKNKKKMNALQALKEERGL